MATIKEILNQALSEVGFKQENSFVGSPDENAQQMLALANREVNKLQKDTWQELTLVMELPLTTATQYPLPVDYREFVFDTAWATNQEYKANFPVTPEVWAYLQSQNSPTGFQYRIRIIGNMIEIYNPQDGASLYAEYISKNAVISAAGVPKERFTADDDMFRLNDDLLIMGVKWRFAKAKGLPYEVDAAEYANMYKRERATNINAQTLSFTNSGMIPINEPYADLLQPYS